MYAYIRYSDSASTWLRNESLLFQLQRAKAAGRSDFVNAWPKTFSASPVGLQSVFISVMRGFGRSENIDAAQASLRLALAPGMTMECFGFSGVVQTASMHFVGACQTCTQDSLDSTQHSSGYHVRPCRAWPQHPETRHQSKTSILAKLLVEFTHLNTTFST